MLFFLSHSANLKNKPRKLRIFMAHYTLIIIYCRPKSQQRRWRWTDYKQTNNKWSKIYTKTHLKLKL